MLDFNKIMPNFEQNYVLFEQNKESYNFLIAICFQFCKFSSFHSSFYFLNVFLFLL